ncbi:MAG: RING finger protein [Anaeromyxobacter sp.]
MNANGLHGGDLSRAVGFTVIGLTTGLMIGVVELLARDAWLKMQAGPLAGKEFVLFKNPTTIGSSPKADIYLFKDAEVEPVHALIHVVGEGYELEDKGGAGRTVVNGRAVRRKRLEAGDRDPDRQDHPLLHREGGVMASPLEVGAAQGPDVGATCAICQTAIAQLDEVGRCPECQAPYHGECWSENGGCAAYGCALTPETLKEQPATAASYWGQEEKTCPMCRQRIKVAAIRCRHCGLTFTSAAPDAAPVVGRPAAPEGRAAALALFAAGVFPVTAPLALVVGGILAGGALEGGPPVAGHLARAGGPGAGGGQRHHARGADRLGGGVGDRAWRPSTRRCASRPRRWPAPWCRAPRRSARRAPATWRWPPWCWGRWRCRWWASCSGRWPSAAGSWRSGRCRCAPT